MESQMMEQIMASHAYDVNAVLEVSPLLQLIEEIFQGCSSTTTLEHGLDERSQPATFVLQASVPTALEISREISCKCSGDKDAHSTTMVVLKILSKFSWDVKVVLALTAFTISYGEFWLVTKLSLTHPLAKSIRMLKQLPNKVKQWEFLMTELTMSILDLTKCIVQSKQSTHIPGAVYWTIRSVIACMSQIVDLVGMGQGFIYSRSIEDWELSSLRRKVIDTKRQLVARRVRFSDVEQKPAAPSSPPTSTIGTTEAEEAETLMMLEILDTHAHNSNNVNVRPHLQIIGEILQTYTSTITLEGALHINHSSWRFPESSVAEKIHLFSFTDMLGALASTVHKISCEISCKCSKGGDANSTTVALFNTLSKFSWDVKVVLAMAAFSIIYGEFWLVVELYRTHPLAKSIALLKQIPNIIEHWETLRPRFVLLRRLIKAMINVTKCIIQFNELPPQYISFDQPPLLVATTHIPIAVYWIIRSIVACASLFIGIIGWDPESTLSTTEAWELSSLAQRVNNIYEHLTKQLDSCNQHIKEKIEVEAYATLVRLFEMTHVNNMKILEALINKKDDLQPLLEGSTRNPRRKVGIEELRNKNVLLLISDMDIPREEQDILDQMYKDSHEQPMRPESQYEMVWVPVVEDKTIQWTEDRVRNFRRQQSYLPWYSVDHPSLIDQVVIKYIKEKWNFNKKPILVVLDPKGKVLSYNALHMVRIWGSNAFPFTNTREEALWKEETWTLELLIDGIDPYLLKLIKEERFICLYGGEDIEWIRKFTRKARAVADDVGIPFEMVFVGKRNPNETLKKIISIISRERLSYCLADLKTISMFWVRLESMWYSKLQHCKTIEMMTTTTTTTTTTNSVSSQFNVDRKTIENDSIMKEIMAMLILDASQQGWALISKGFGNNNIMAKARGDMILRCFQRYVVWKEDVGINSFIQAISNHLLTLRTPHHCSRLILPRTGLIPEMVVCIECGRIMETFVMYSCCN